MAAPTIFIAVFAGLISFFSPCILPVLPGFLAFITGSTKEFRPSRTQTFLASFFFVLGFSLVFAVLGVLLNTLFKGVSNDVQIWLARVGGLVIIIFALHLLELITIPFLLQEKKIEIKRFSHQYVTSFIFGAAFAVGWTPCVGIILGSVLALAIAQPGTAFILLIFYAIGLGVPFLILGIFTEEAIGVVRKSTKILKYFNITVGILMLILGVLVFTNNLNLISAYLPQWLK